MHHYPTILWLLFLASVACTRNNRSISIKGSDTEVNITVQLAEAFHTIYPGYFLSVSGGGSGLGIASLLNGTADVANSSRRIRKDESDLFAAKSTIIDSFIFAQDAIAFIINANIHLDSINGKNLAKLLNGFYKTWAPLIHQNLPVTIYGRQSNSGTHDFVQQKLGIEFSPYAKEMNGNAQILESVKIDRSGIGYVGAGYVMHSSGKGFKVLKIIATGGNAVSPLDSVAIAQSQYLFQRPLFQYFKKTEKEKIACFLNFEKSAAGLAIIKQAGYYTP